MRTKRRSKIAFTLVEMLVATAIASVVLACVVATFTGLQKSFNATGAFFYTHLQQIRIIDYLSRDVKRSYNVHTTTSPQTVTCTMPKYIVQTGDWDAGAGGANVGKRRAPVVVGSLNGIVVNYGRSVTDAVTTNGSATLNSATANFTVTDVGGALSGNGIPNGTTIQSFASATSVTMSTNATASTTNDSVTIVPQTTVVYSISGKTILRTENNVVTTIASSTDQLVPSNLAVDVANTEYLNSSVTFLPIFTSGNSAVETSGTAVFATAYLRNLRRGN